jgi:hypothetical protein
MSRDTVRAAWTAALIIMPSLAFAWTPGEPLKGTGARMSAMGGTALDLANHVIEGQSALGTALSAEACTNNPRCVKFGDAPAVDDGAGPSGGQAETSVAVDPSGLHVVLGYNDTRGFSLPAISVSGVMVSHDGGKTFADLGQLPTPGDQVIGTTRFPQVFGDPEVKNLGGCNFVYASILVVVKEFLPGVPTPVQTMGLHRSRDCGNTWEGPFEIESASNPNGYIYSDGSAVDAADKEFMDVDQKTGRLIMSWSNFTNPVLAPGGVQISTTYSDDAMSAGAPTWSTFKVVSAIEADGQSSIPRFAQDGKTVYVAWRRFPFPGTFFGYGNVIATARSDDGGDTWNAPVETSPEFFTMDQVLGNDRVNTSPSLAVGPRERRKNGDLYLVYSNNDLGDGADIVFQRSGDGGTTWSEPLRINNRPGQDGPQWFPWVTVDDRSGRVFVHYYDQGVAQTGDLTQVSYQFAEGRDLRWSAPAALSDRPFHAGWGNDTGQPNLGDYNQAVVVKGKYYAALAYSTRPPLGFADGQPSTSMTVPDSVVKVLPNDAQEFEATPLEWFATEARDLGFATNGRVDPNEFVAVQVTLRNPATNALFADTLREIRGKLGTDTPGVKVLVGGTLWPRLRPGETAPARFPFVIRTTSAFVPGTPIELTLSVESDDRETALLRDTLFTGTPVETTLFSEDFDDVTGWSVAHGGGANVVPWVIGSASPASPGFCGATSRYAFHQNASDGPPGGSRTRWERLLSPLIVVPGDSAYVEIEMDVCYDTEEDPNFNVLAYDGFFLRLTDFTSGRTLRSVLVEAFADEFTTGGVNHYPRHLPRSSNRAYFEDMSAWAGFSDGPKHVRMRLPGMAGSTFQLRFEFTQDGSVSCSDLRPGNTCGVSVDNIVVRSARF